jgi:hypothetical protein
MNASLQACLAKIKNGKKTSPLPWMKTLKRAAILCVGVILVAGTIFIIQTFIKPKAELRVSTTPLGAQVFIDDEFKGKTPFKIKLPMGKHEVRLSLPEYYEWEAQLQLDKKGETPLEVDLEPMVK